MPRLTVKLLLLDEQDPLLLIHASDPGSGQECWYPVGGGIEPGETTHQAAAREAAEETGLVGLSPGAPVWVRDHTYAYDGCEVEVREEWLLHRVRHFDPAPTALSDYESRSIKGFRWWRTDDLAATADTVYPPRLGDLLSTLLEDGVPAVPIDINEKAAQLEPFASTDRVGVLSAARSRLRWTSRPGADGSRRPVPRPSR